MHKLSPRMQAAHDKAEIERKLVKEWLLEIMRASSQRTRTKEDLQTEAIARFKVSKSAFNYGWMWAIEVSGNEHWYDPLPRGKAKANRPLSS